MFRNIVAALVLVPLTVIIAAFAVANRQIVTVSLDPFGANPPAAAATLPLFALVLLLLIAGVLIGGTAAWLGQGKWRRAARRLDYQVDELRREIESLKATTGPTSIPPAIGAPPRLRIMPPV